MVAYRWMTTPPTGDPLINFSSEDLDPKSDPTANKPGHVINSILVQCAPEAKEHLLTKLRDPNTGHATLATSLKKILEGTEFAKVSENSVKSWRNNREFWEDQL